jgi:hypothetical protein
MRATVASLLSIAAILLGSTACGGAGATRRISNRVDADLFGAFPPEGKRQTYEAENEVIIALDRLDAAKDGRVQIEARIEDVEHALDTADKRGGAGSEVHKARKGYLEARLDHAKAEIRAAEQAVYCARVSLELTKARLVVKFDLPVEAGYIKPFDEQYQACATRLDETKKDAEKLAGEAVQAKENWRKVRADFVQKTGDHNHGLWID